ncbi:MAG: efflux RND transporter periplasmic adaptor subunit [Planctomycetes bacterium]|nr:efflux RND transporter periplasmic adaptor subunit [Planctomycetota bacterium]
MRLVAPLLLSLALGVAACDRPTEAREPEDLGGALQRHEPTRVRVAPVARREMVRTLETTTTVESEHHVVLHARGTGELLELFAEEGDTVEAGALLARLDQRDLAAQLADARVAHKEAEDSAAKGEIALREAEADIEQARLAFEQAKRNYERNDAARLISAQDLEKLKLEMETAESTLEARVLAKDRAALDARAATTAVERAALAVERAEVALSYTELRAPFAGVISQRTCQVGDHVSAADACFELIDLANLRTVFHRPQRELALFGGLEEIAVEARAEALPGAVFPGRIQRISPSIEAASGSFRVTVRLAPEAGGARLLPGMLLRLRLVVERHPDALVVPKRALKREGDTTLVYAVRDGLASGVVVLEGFGDDADVEVLPQGDASLVEGEPVVVVGNRDLEDGKEVVVVDEHELEGAADEAATTDAAAADATDAEAGQG